LLLARPLPDWSASGVWIQAGAGATLVGAALAILALRGVQAGAPAVHFPAAALLALWFFAPAAILTGIDLFTGKELLTHLRYSVIAVPGLAGLLALAAAGLPRPRVVAFGIAAAIAVALTIESPAIRNPDARGAAAVVRQIERPGDLLIFDAQGWIPYWARREFVQVWHYLPESPRHVLMLNAPPSAATREQIAAFERIVVVSPRVEQRPNPAPATHHLAFSSPYLYDIGWVCLFVRDDGWLGGDANPAPAAGVSGTPRHGQAAGRRFPYRGRAWRPLAHATHAIHAIHATHCDPCHPTPSMPPMPPTPSMPPSSAAPQPRVPDTPAPPHSRWEANGPPARQGWSPGSGATRARRFSTSRRCVSSAARRVCRST
jgi:hypothetical protein